MYLKEVHRSSAIGGCHQNGFPILLVWLTISQQTGLLGGWVALPTGINRKSDREITLEL